MNVDFSSPNRVSLKVPHCIFCISDVIVRNHHKSTVFALRVHVSDGAVGLKKHAQLLIFNGAIDISHEKRSGRMFSVRMFDRVTLL